MDILTYRRIILKVVSTNQYGPNKKAFVQKKNEKCKKSPRVTKREARGLKRESDQQTTSSQARDLKSKSGPPITSSKARGLGRESGQPITSSEARG